MSNEKREYRVAVYVRVPTDADISYEPNLYKDYYNGLALSRCQSKVLQYYVDKGIAGASTDSREAYRQLIDDCKMDKYDLILTKSISRFGANAQECIEACKMLSSLNPPVEVYFDNDDFSTFSPDAENRFSEYMMFLLAEAEAKTKSIRGSFHRPFVYPPNEIKTIFYHRRKEKGLTQAEVAKRANISVNRYWKYEKGIALDYQSEECSSICSVLGIEPIALSTKKTFAVNFRQHRLKRKT